MGSIGLTLFWLTTVAFRAPASACFGSQSVTAESQPRFLPARPHENPFDVTRHLVPLSEIQDSGVGRDEIIALSCARFSNRDHADKQLKNSEPVLGVSWNEDAKAYPIRILNWHELVNDSVGGRPILVSW